MCQANHKQTASKLQANRKGERVRVRDRVRVRGRDRERVRERYFGRRLAREARQKQLKSNRSTATDMEYNTMTVQFV